MYHKCSILGLYSSYYFDRTYKIKPIHSCLIQVEIRSKLYISWDRGILVSPWNRMPWYPALSRRQSQSCIPMDTPRLFTLHSFLSLFFFFPSFLPFLYLRFFPFMFLSFSCSFIYSFFFLFSSSFSFLSKSFFLFFLFLLHSFL